MSNFSSNKKKETIGEKEQLHITLLKFPKESEDNLQQSSKNPPASTKIVNVLTLNDKDQQKMKRKQNQLIINKELRTPTSINQPHISSIQIGVKDVNKNNNSKKRKRKVERVMPNKKGLNKTKLLSHSRGKSEYFVETLLNENDKLIKKIEDSVSKKSGVNDCLKMISKFRENIINILTCLTSMSGVMSAMPPIPIKLSTICVVNPSNPITPIEHYPRQINYNPLNHHRPLQQASFPRFGLGTRAIQPPVNRNMSPIQQQQRLNHQIRFDRYQHPFQQHLYPNNFVNQQ